MTIGQILQQARSQPNEALDTLSVEVLLAFVLEKGREFLIGYPEFELTEVQKEMFVQLFQRYSAGEPVAYLIGKKEFFGLDFFVDSRVLIPRPETELLVEKILELSHMGRIPYDARILEVGTGSGCISVALAHNHPAFRLVATDVSPDALEVAARNIESHGVGQNIRLIESDLLAAFDEKSPVEADPFDVVVANLPYIGHTKFHFVSREAFEYEPHVALFGGENGLFLYDQLFSQVCRKSWNPSYILGEFGFLQREELERTVWQNFSQDRNALDFFPDYAKIDRVFLISRKDK